MRTVQGQRICVLCFNITIGSRNCRYHVRFTKYNGAPCHLHQFPNQKRDFRFSSPSMAPHQKRDWVPLPACLHHLFPNQTALPVQLTIHGPSPETGLGTASGLPTHPCRAPLCTLWLSPSAAPHQKRDWVLLPATPLGVRALIQHPPPFWRKG